MLGGLDRVLRHNLRNDLNIIAGWLNCPGLTTPQPTPLLNASSTATSPVDSPDYNYRSATYSLSLGQRKFNRSKIYNVRMYEDFYTRTRGHRREEISKSSQPGPSDGHPLAGRSRGSVRGDRTECRLLLGRLVPPLLPAREPTNSVSASPPGARPDWCVFHSGGIR